MWRSMAILALGGLISGVAQAQSMPAGCYPVKGKIVNNLHTPIPLHTMGVAAVVFANNVKVKCAVEGTPAVPTNPSPDSLAFVHTLSCDDAIATPLGPVHSKVQVNTQGTVNFATGFFTETSTPIEGSGTGLFQGVTASGSYLSIEGRVLPSGAVDMTFTGQLCY